MYSPEVIQTLAKESQEPSWVTQLREAAFTKHQTLPWPHSSDDIWRRTDVALLDPTENFSPAISSGNNASFEKFTQPLGDERLFVRAHNQWLTQADIPAGKISNLTELAQAEPDLLKRIFSGEGMTEAEAKLATLNEAFHQEGVFIDFPRDTVDETPWRLVQLIDEQPNRTSFPMTVIRVGTGSKLTLIDEYIGVSAESDQPHLVHGRIELILEPGAQLHYVRVQNLGKQTREFLLQRAEVPQDATLTLANLNLGASLSKAHLGAELSGAGASSKIYGFVFGSEGQHIDQHTLQDHQAPHTSSDLKFKAALQDKSRMIFTGLIRIAAQAQHTEAFQENRNLLLTDKARAETIPMLEILADDVQCKHAASTGPVDDEQVFYLMCRGMSRRAAERLVVMGFIEEVVEQVPFEPLRDLLRQRIEGELHDLSTSPA